LKPAKYWVKKEEGAKKESARIRKILKASFMLIAMERYLRLL